jgi:hypothetical protein
MTMHEWLMTEIRRQAQAYLASIPSEEKRRLVEGFRAKHSFTTGRNNYGWRGIAGNIASLAAINEQVQKQTEKG